MSRHGSWRTKVAWGLVLVCCGWFGRAGAAERILYIQAHGDDIIQMAAKIYMERHPDAGREPADVYMVFTANEWNAKVPELLKAYLDVPPDHVRFLQPAQPIAYKTGVLEQLVEIIKEIEPDTIFVQCWAGSHPDHEMTQPLVTRALEIVGLSPTMYEYPMQTGLYYDEYIADPSVTTLDLFWNSLVDLEGVDEAPTVEVDESPAALDAKVALVEHWSIPWMMDLLERYGEDALRANFLNHERYRALLRNYDYTRRPYEDPTLVELNDDYPYVCDDLRNYAACLWEPWGADLWTVPWATHASRRWRLVAGRRYRFKIGLINKADEADTFELTAAWGTARTPAPEVTIDTPEVRLDGRRAGPRLCPATLDTTGLAGDVTLWIKATSRNAGGDEGTDYVEIPLMLHISPGGSGWHPPLGGPGFGEILAPCGGGVLFGTLAGLLPLCVVKCGRKTVRTAGPTRNRP